MSHRNILIACILCLLWAVPAQAAPKTLKIAYVEWDCATASSYLAKEVLESRLGYKVELVALSGPVMWTSLATNDADAMLTAWLPYTHADMYAKVKDKVDIVGKVADGARLGLAVPDYVSITSVEELDSHADKFKGRITGIDPGAGIMTLTEKLIKAYGLKKMELLEGSGAIMTSSLGNAIRKKEWIVVTGWSPHWMFGRWNLRYLDDPKKILGEEESIFAVTRKNLTKDQPEAATFLSKFHYTGAAQLQTLMAWGQEKGSNPQKAAQRFIKEFPQQVESWLAK